MSDTNTDLLTAVRDLHKDVAEGRLMEALDRYYADDVVMQENTDPPVEGLAANRVREQEWLESVAEFRRFELVHAAVEGDVSFAETVLEYVTTGGDVVHTEQVSRARWRDGRIVSERFYHG